MGRRRKGSWSAMRPNYDTLVRTIGQGGVDDPHNPVGSTQPRPRGAFSCVPSMIDSLEVEVLYPA